MTILVYADRKFYSDSRTSYRNKIVSDHVDKIVIPHNRSNPPLWENEQILAIMATGKSESIRQINTILLWGGKKTIDNLNEVSNIGQLELFSTYAGFVATTNKLFKIEVIKNKIVYKELDINQEHILGSGMNGAAFAYRVIKTDGIGAICTAMIQTNTCGGFVLSTNPWEKVPKIKSEHYRYLKLRIVWGIFLRKYKSLKEKYLYR